MKAWRSAPAWHAAGWAAAALGLVAYAVLAHHAASVAAPGLLEASVFILPLMAIALAMAWRARRRVLWLALWCALAGVLLLVRDRLGAGTQWVLLLQHVAINSMLCLAFGRTLAPGSVPLVSRFAEIVNGKLTPRVVRYTRSVTWAWVVYFGLTAIASVLLFALAPLPVWSIFVNLLSLPLLMAMFVGEFVVRSLVIPRSERSSLMKSLTAYRQFSRGNANKR